MDLLKLKAVLGLDSSQYEQGLDNAKGKASSVGSVIGNGLKTIAKVGVAAIGTATTAVVGFAASSVEVGKTFDASMSQVAATMGVSKAEIADLEEFAKEMGRTTAFSATQAAEALNYMALAGYDADTSMQMLPNVLNLAAAGNMDLARASDMVTDAQTALGLSLEQTTELVDMMALTSSKTNTGVEQLGDAILTIGGTAKIMAGGTTELNKMLGVLADNGIKGSEAGTKLRNVLLSLSAPTDKAAEKLEALHVSAIDETTGDLRALDDIMLDLNAALEGMGSAEKAEVINTIFNKQDIAAVNALLDTSADRYDELETEINGAWIASKNFDNGFKGTSLQKMQDNLVKAGVSADDFNNLLKKSGGNAGAFVDELSAISGLDVNEVLQLMGTNLRMLQTEFDHVEGSAKQMAQTQLDNLAGDITLWKSALEGVQLLISGALAPELREFVQFGTEGLTKISDAFEQGGLSGAMEAFRGVLSDGIAMVTEKIPDFINAGMELLGALGQGILDNTPQIVNAAVQIGVMLVQGLVEAGPELAKGAITIIETLGQSFAENQSTLFEAGKKLLSMLINGITQGYPMLLGLAVELVQNIAGYISENGTSLVQSAAELIHHLVTGLAENIPALIEGATNIIIELVMALTDPSAITQLVMAAAELIMGLANGLLVAIPKLIDAIPQIISNLVAALVAAVPQILFVGIQLIIGLVTGLIQAIPRIVAAVPALILALVGGLKRGIEQIVQVGRDMVAGLWKGIKERWDALVSDFQGLASGLVDGIKGLFGIHSPSRVFAEIGRNLDAGLAKGIKDNLGMVESAMGELDNYTNIEPQISTITNGTQGGYNDIINLLREIASSDKNTTIVLEGDANRLFRVVQRESVRNKQITGQESFA